MAKDNEDEMPDMKKQHGRFRDRFVEGGGSEHDCSYNPPKAHPGFASVAAGISRNQGIPMAGARAILAKRTRMASAAAKKRNPRLMKVKGV